MKDHLTLFEGKTRTSSSIVTLSGQLSTLERTTFQTLGNALTVEFQTDGMMQSRGFKANFTFTSTIEKTTTKSTMELKTPC